MMSMKQVTIRRLDRMDGQLEALLEQVGQYSHEVQNRVPADGGWTALQTMHHLILAERGSLGYVQKKLSYNPTLTKAGLRERYRAWLVQTYLKTPFKVKAPAVVSGNALPKESNFEEVAQRWRADRTAMRAYLLDLPEEAFSSALYKHPLAGRMSLSGMLGFFDAHFQRHRKQVLRALK